MELHNLPDLKRPFLTPKELADAMGVTRRTVYRWITEEGLETVQAREGGDHRIFPWRLAEFFDEETALTVTNTVKEMREKS
jgi:excisionase family DNA binding protein